VEIWYETGVTILGLMVVVALVATSLVALRSTLEIWTSAYFSLTVDLLCTAIPGMAFRRSIRRAFWAGFASLGWTYLVLCFGPVPGTLTVKAPTRGCLT
jgi:hypothetical protein